MFGYTVIVTILDDGEVFIQTQGGFLPDKEKISMMKTAINSLSKLTEDQIEFENWKRDKKYEEDHIRMNEGYEERRSTEKIDPFGSIYLMRDIYRGCYKIGFTKSLKSRIDQLRTANAGIEYMKHYEGRMSDEKHLHDVFSGVIISGEWFRLNEVHIDFIEQYFSSKSA